MTQRPAPSPDLEWLIAALWTSTGARVDVTRGDSAVAGERYAIVPSASRARFLLPSGRPRAAAASLRSYNRLRPWSIRLARSVVATATLFGMGRLVSGDLLEVGFAEGDESLSEVVRGILGRSDVSFAVGLPPRGPNRKPVLQAFSHVGEPLAFVKVGWNEITNARVVRESQALKRWRDAPPGSFCVPEILAEKMWRGLQISVTAPLPADVRRYTRRDPPELQLSREVWASDEPESRELAAHPYLESLRTRAAVSITGGRAELVDRFLDLLVDRRGDEVIEFGAWHGDWTPWNMARSRGIVYVFDWEHWGASVPLGLDLVHWYFQASFVLDKRPPADSWRRAQEVATPWLRGAGISEESAAVTARLYLIEMALRMAESVAVGGTPNPRWEASIDSLLREENEQS